MMNILLSVFPFPFQKLKTFTLIPVTISFWANIITAIVLWRPSHTFLHEICSLKCSSCDLYCRFAKFGLLSLPPYSLPHLFLLPLSLTISSSSASMRSYAERATQKTMAVTPSKQWIHFFLSDRCPPTSNILTNQSQTSRKQVTNRLTEPHSYISQQAKPFYNFAVCKSIKALYA